MLRVGGAVEEVQWPDPRQSLCSPIAGDDASPPRSACVNYAVGFEDAQVRCIGGSRRMNRGGGAAQGMPPPESMDGPASLQPIVKLRARCTIAEQEAALVQRDAAECRVRCVTALVPRRRVP
jgi:hypothetical protein